MLRRQPATIVKCRYCSKIVKHPSKIAEHMRTHTGDRPFVCHICNQGFAQGHPLKVHIRNHFGEKPFECGFQCGKHFSTTSQRSSHERIHTGERIYFKCPVECCTIKYGKKYRIKEHVKEMHPEVDLEEVGLTVPPKKILINSVEELIATVQEPEDVEEEEIWADEQYYEESEINQGHFVDSSGNRFIVRYEEPNGETALASIDPNESSITDAHDPGAIFHMDPLTGEIFESAEAIGDYLNSTDENVEEAPINEEIERLPTHFDQSQMIDPDDLDLQPNIEEEVMTSSDTVNVDYVDPLEENKHIVSIYIPEHPPAPIASAAVATRRSARETRSALLAASQQLLQRPQRPRPVMSPPISNEPIIADPRPPKRGRRKGGGKTIEEVIQVNPELAEMAAPLPINGDSIDCGRSRKIIRPARNLDWIINAIARGIDIDYASPHNRRKPMVHRCEYCGKVDKYPSKIKAHMRTHTGERPFECQICGMGFAQRTAMRMHVRRHLNQKPYICSFGCGARFINGALLNVHETTKHMGVKKYICMRGCGRSFAQRKNRIQHEENCQFVTFNKHSSDIIRQMREMQESVESTSLDVMNEENPVR